MGEALRAAVVVDYQNIHLTAHTLFAEPGEAKHETLIDPLHFANALIAERNRRQREGHPHAELQRVLAYRGQPSSEHDPRSYGRTDAQRAAWRASNPRVEVHYRPLRYLFEAGGNYSTRTGHAPRAIKKVEEKGIDVLCALAVVEQSRADDVDLVILASHDTDLEPCLDAALDIGTARIETCQWWNPSVSRTKQLRPTSDRGIWNTRMGTSVYEASRDRHIY
ncbi:hypothetical protein H483_0117835 [Dietzia sp. UCD-THP]|uniref:NYN domain-containing protein n=1 Tax=Dietzia sp. UCD-THP TaxID=1292020 RepID=UPI000437A3EF|nr:NYN domain-containing protein [Dietzia sp. UCD-THP]EYT52565.1 hypothetical protein H483_0117835 [Dietzia sp. UCD-THP]